VEVKRCAAEADSGDLVWETQTGAEPVESDAYRG